jgi:prolyl-tRNA synthetase
MRLHQAASASKSAVGSAGEDIKSQIIAAGDKVRALKADNGAKEEIEVAVKTLLDLKNSFEVATGEPYDIKTSDTKKKTPSNASGKGKQQQQSVGAGGSTRITPRAEDYSAWYNDLVYESDLIDLSPVRGCAVIKPWGMGIWDAVRKELDDRITNELEASNAYFPLFIPKSFLSKEAEHVDGFAKECAVVTHHRLCANEAGDDLIPDPDSVLEEPLIVRPTSETIIWHMFGKWINSYRDLPLKINQWANVVRWELRTRPFLRTAEFLWQEGHTAHATKADAMSTARSALDMYAAVCEDMLAIPVVKGNKSPAERFAGADDTLTIEALMQNGWALQSGTSHFLGQNFAKAFDVFYQSENGDRELVWATSWGVSTRLLGALVMTHSDDKGLVLPPPVAPLQVVIVPIKQELDSVRKKVDEIYGALKAAGVRVKVDDRDHMRPGAKYFEWERKGVPIRLDIGPRDVENDVAVITTRHNGEKSTISTGSDVVSLIQSTSSLMHQQLLEAARDRLARKTFHLSSYDDMKSMITKAGDGDIESAGFYLVPWKCDESNEEAIKTDCKATIRCYPFEHNQEAPASGTKCFYSGEQATHMAIFARAF